MRLRPVRVAVTVLLVVAAVAVSMLVSWLPFGAFLVIVTHEQPFRQKPFERVVSAIESGRLRPDDEGIVELPGRERRFVHDGCVYVTRLRDSTRLVLFVTWRGKGFNLKGYVHCGRPLRRADMFTPPEQGQPGWVQIVALPRNFAGTHLPAQQLEVQLDRQVRPS